MQIEPPSYLNFILLQKGVCCAHAAIVHYNLLAAYYLQKAVNCRVGVEGGGACAVAKRSQPLIEKIIENQDSSGRPPP